MTTLRRPMALPENFEPAERDPVKLRRTALILVGVMIVGGWFVMRAYSKWTQERHADDRPAIIHRIDPKSSLKMARQDKTQQDLVDQRQNVLAVHVIELDQLEDSELSINVLKRTVEKYKDRDDFIVLTLLLNPGSAEGLDAKLER